MLCIRTERSRIADAGRVEQAEEAARGRRYKANAKAKKAQAEAEARAAAFPYTVVPWSPEERWPVALTDHLASA